LDAAYSTFLTNRDAVNVALNLGCGVLEVVADQQGRATG
jgi:hypothetical protein